VRLLLLCSLGLLVIAACTDDEGQHDASSDAGIDVTRSDAGDIDSSTTGDGSVGAGMDADAPPLIPQCNPLSPFNPPVRVAGLESETTEWSASVSENGLVATLTRLHDADGGSKMAVFTAKRAAVDKPWGTPVHETVFDAIYTSVVSVSNDGLTLFLGEGSLWISQRASTAAPWPAPTKWSETVSGDTTPSLLHDGSAVYFVRNQAVHRAPRTGPGTYGSPVKLAWASTTPNDPRGLAVTADELTMYLGARPPTSGPFDMNVSRRTAKTDPWGPPTKIVELSSPGPDWASWTTPDGCELYLASFGDFDSGIAGSFDIWKAKRPP
jgi:hypothetical protein